MQRERRTASAVPRSAAVALLLLPSLLALAASGQPDDGGLGMSPERFTVPAAQPGESYQLTVLLQNRRGVDDVVEVSLEGEAGAWATTDPASSFAIAAGADREVTVRIEVPEDTGPGRREGLARFTGQPGDGPAGSGASVRPSLGLLLDVTVGGEPVVRLTWLGARAEDAQAGQPVPAFVQVRNDGNVRATAEAIGAIVPFDADEPALSEADGSLLVTPGEAAEVPLQFAAGLAAGQYRARLGSADGTFSQVVEFKVVPAGQRAPAGTLRLLDHDPRAAAGRPVKVEGWFENTGDVAIASARLTLEVRRDGDLVQALSSGSLVVAAGAHSNLTVYLTPDEPGSYTISGTVGYDGYQTLPRESLLSVAAEGDGWSWGWLLLLLLILALLGVGWAWRRGRRDAEERDGRRTGRR